MCTRVASLAVCSFLSVSGPILIGCAPNAPYRTEPPANCAATNCEDAASFLERHDGFDLAFVEFSERGNVFDRKRMQQVLDYVAAQAGYDPSNPDRGVITVVFVHGWKHNAAADDENVRDFRELLRKASVLSNGGPRKVIGVYIGWPGLSIDFGPFTNISYWDRKEAAQQVAEGGVPELILRLERGVIDDARPNRNLYLVTGHSFGGAIVLSALNSFVLERVAEAGAKNPDHNCVETRPFGHGVVLLNPAIEANKVFQLKELVAETCFGRGQGRLMHVISSDADDATHYAFRLAQWLGVSLTWKQARLTREFAGRVVQFDESDLDTIAVGNFKPFHSGQLGRLGYRSCIGPDAACFGAAQRVQQIPQTYNEPVAFIYTDETFIADHNDVFNDNVSAYLAAIIAEGRAKRSVNYSSVQDPRLPLACQSYGFDFWTCLAGYRDLFERILSLGEAGGQGTTANRPELGE